MIKDVMVCLEGTAADDVRLAAVEIIAGLFKSHVIGLFLNTVPSTVAVDANRPGATLLDEAREFGDGVERERAERLTQLNRPTEIHRIDVLAEITRLDEPAKRWKFSLGDIAERKLWDKYMAAYEDMIRATSQPEARWYVVPADHKWFARLLVAGAMIEALEGLDLQFPKIEHCGRQGRRKRLSRQLTQTEIYNE